MRLGSLKALLGQLSWPPFAPDLPLEALRRRYQLPASRYLEVAGVRLHITVEGPDDGEPLLLIHGLSSSLHTWDGWAGELKDHYRIVRFDLPGFGLTGPHPQRRYDADTLVDLVEALRDKLGLENMYVAGSSLGGFVAWMYALRHPDRVRKLVLIDPVAYAQEPLGFMKLLALPGSEWIGLRLNPQRSVERGVVDVFGDASKVPAAVVRRYQELALRPGNRAALVDVCRLLLQMVAKNPYETLIPGLRVPTFLMWGRLDRWIPLRHVELWKRDVPGLRTKIYEGIGHIPMEEAPEETARDARAFFSS